MKRRCLYRRKKAGKPGKFELADGGTIFLDEVKRNSSLNIQAKLLTVIQDRVVERIGGVTPRSIDIHHRCLNKDLLQNDTRKLFEDLY